MLARNVPLNPDHTMFRRNDRDLEPAGPIQQLQEVLAELGFDIVGTPDGVFGHRTDLAVREFQTYAGLENVAAEQASAEAYADRLVAVPNDHRRELDVHGIADELTLDSLRAWHHEGYRCPVVIERWRMSGGRRADLLGDNIWWPEEVETGPERVYVRDHSDRWPIPESRIEDGRVVLGDRARLGSFTGPRCLGGVHTWPEAEIIPQTVYGRPWNALTEAERSTFRVLRPVAELECQGYWDGYNGYDSAVVSVGPCHWTLSLRGGSGELPATLAWFRDSDPEAYRRSFGVFGLDIAASWEESGEMQEHPRQLWNSSHRKYEGRAALPRDPEGGATPLEEGSDLYEWFRSWHVAYRFIMAARTLPAWRQAQWDLARMRVRDILTTPLSASARREIGAADDAILGDVATSERLVCLLLRWHVWRPGHLIHRGETTGRITTALNGLPEPETWSDGETRRFAHQLLEVADEVEIRDDVTLRDRLERLARWPTWSSEDPPRGWRLDAEAIGPLEAGVGTFRFDSAGLPRR